MEIKERILYKATEMCFRFGIRSVTMDDIAKELGISKKTIYTHFEDKDEIIYQIMQSEMLKDKCEWNELGKNAKNIIEKMINAQHLMKKSMEGINPSIFLDIKRFHPRAWALFQSHKHQFILKTITDDINKGIEEGLFRKDINVEFMGRYRMEQVELGFDPAVFPTEKYNMIEIQTTLMDHFIRGILTEKGLNQYNTYQQSVLL
jgi:TetR/AcrR family transcriptional regulator, cholesterol catabolism regulator